MVTRRDYTEQESLSPRLSVSFKGWEFSGATGPKSFSLTSSLTNIYDGFIFELDNADGRNDKVLNANIHRWTPIVIRHADPLVDGGKSIPAMMGVITRVEANADDQPSTITVSGYDLGKLFDSCGPVWYRIRGHTWQQLLDACIDASWRAAPATGGIQWGIQGVRGQNLNKKIKIGRYAAVQDYGTKYQQFVPPVQIEPGETVYDTLSRYARLTGYQGQTTGSLVNVSADGWVQIFNPDDSANDPPLYSFVYDRPTEREPKNQRIKSGRLILDGEQLYSEYRVYGSIIVRPGDPNKLDNLNPNAGKFKAISSMPGYLGVNRLSASNDGECYLQSQADARVEWRRRMALYNETTLPYTVAGHCWPGPDGRWVPIVEGNICELDDRRLRRKGRYLIESVTRSQQDAPGGTTTRLVLKPVGLLGA
jgi:hypothetical protein